MAIKRIYPFIMARPYSIKPREGVSVMLDAREVEGYREDRCNEKNTPDCVTVYMKSGRELTLSNNVDQKVYPGHNLCTLIDSVHCSHFWHDNEDSTSDEE